MKFPQTHTLKQIATIINAEFVGDDKFPVEGMSLPKVILSL
jgi:UDP-3-O-[3-hydroxymyristoyl] glucosamine N-acyltransferase